ncbi:lipoprotein-releasing ABC transporter ATP-binding protein LolD [Parashewanella curva]|uniref:Lipoprotein-releasing system ATP-binding protein LolD n=1 Tax=Parashewanella curva TaxID=2338552 RepID=A0A3L8PYX1_9GAMM|nr:lipoprotein-releasing ABC transporter ATP-binding protein LolD [Parashewanella curva]RLV59708.1 lipoprotein-releasing ABC transporter ATP-binding protein LolD [Parashewanella curva]
MSNENTYTMEQKLLLNVENLSKVFDDGEVETQVLHEVNLKVYSGEQLAIVGSSGSGKSTLLHILGTLDQPTAGQVFFDGEDLYQMSSGKHSRLRNTEIGFIYQFHHLLPEFTALENVAMPALIQGKNKSAAFETAKELLIKVGLEHRLTHTPAELSGGERQRVAIARALINQPKLVLADEPTGNLDSNSSEVVYQLIQDLAKQLGTAFVVVTHDQNLANRMDRQVTMVNGRLTELDGSVA